MNTQKLIAIILLTWLTKVISGANILALLSMNSQYNLHWKSPLAIALAQREHNVQIISTSDHKQLEKGKLTYEVLKYEEPYWNPEDVDHDASVFNTISSILERAVETCEIALQNQETQQLLLQLNTSENITYDLVIYEPIYGECLLGMLHKFGSPPIVALTEFSDIQWINNLVGNPDSSTYIPNTFLAYSNQMSFLQRLYNVMTNLYMEHQWNSFYLSAVDAIMKKYFGPITPGINQILRNISIVLVNTIPSFDYVSPRVPALIPVAGMHITEPQPLEKELKVFLDKSRHGAILFSLGSNLRSEYMEIKKRWAFLRAFETLDQRVLWKWESDNLSRQPKNVKISRGLLETDVLAHPNVKLFITEANVFSIQEAIHHAVPIIGIPFGCEQQHTMQKVINQGIGIQLDYQTIKKSTILEAITQVLENISYAQNAHKLSTIFRDQQETPLQRAVYWCEYVIRHKGASHLQSTAMDLSWYQYLLLDVISIIILLPTIIVVLLLCCCCAIFTKKKAREKQRPRVKQKNT